MRTPFRRLLAPGHIAGLETKNRIVMPPMGVGLSGVWGEVTDALIEWYATRARGGPGITFVQAAYCATAIDGLRQPQTQLRADDDVYAPGLSRLAEAIHEGGSLAGIQLSPGLGAQARGGPWVPGRQTMENVLAVSPSGVMSPEVKRPARPLEIQEIEKIVELFGKAVARCKRAGFDIIEIHSHAGHLLAQFMSPYFNRRTDKYGGSVENRMRFLDEIVGAARQNAGPGFPLGIKFSIDEMIPGGRTLADGIAIAKRLRQEGIDFISISAGIHGAKVSAIPSCYYEEGTFISMAEAVKKDVDIVVLLPGRMDNPDLAERTLREGKADFISWGRALIADPEMPRKVAGNGTPVRQCIACNSCMRTLWTVKPVRCTVNPVAGRELEYPEMETTGAPKRIAVIGAGPAGMEAAMVAGLRGHDVRLIEKGRTLGGMQLRVGSRPPHKDTLLRIPAYYAAVFESMPNVEVQLNKEATSASILAWKPDAVIVATGSQPLVPGVPGAHSARVVTASDVLAGTARVGQQVVLIGGGSVGCETANFLARQKKKITVVEMLERAGADVEAWTWNALERELSEGGVKILTKTKMHSITQKGVMVADEAGALTELPADTIVLAVGSRSADRLGKSLQGKVPEVHIVGDARKPGTIRDAIAEAHALARRI